MRVISRENWLAAALFILMGIMTAVGVVQQIQAESVDPPLTSSSSQPDGALVLFQWLDEIGFSVSDDVQNQFGIPESTDLVLLLEPTQPVTDLEWNEIDEWVESGGTLVMAGSSFVSLQAFNHFDVVLQFRQEIGIPTVDSPILTRPVVPNLAEEEVLLYLNTARSDMVPLLSVNGRPVMLTFAMGEGRVILSSLVLPFSNFGIQQEGNAELLLNLVGQAGDRVWFNEWHHGVRPESERAINWLQGTPIGRSILYTLGVVFIWLVLRGRNFGRPVPQAKALTRRAPIEYITAVANLSRRAGHRGAVLQDTHDRLKRELGTRYRLSPTLPDQDFVNQLAQFEPNLNQEKLFNLLARLSKTAVSETELVQLMQEAAKFEK